MKLPFSSAPENLCLLRLSAVGDVCHTLAVVRSIQTHWPQTKLTWIIGKLEATLINDIPGIEFIVFDKSMGHKAYADLRGKLQGRRFDALLHMQASLRSSIASRLVNTSIRLGFDKARARDLQWLFTNNKIKAVAHQHVMDGLFEFAVALGVTTRELRWDIPIPTDANQFADQHLPDSKPFAIISPCSSARFRNWRNWSVEGYAQVCDYLMEKHNIVTVLTGGPSQQEQEYGEGISHLASHKPINLIGKSTLKQLLAMISRAKFVISPDSGPAHMATTVGTPVIGLYVTSNPLRTGPYLSQQWVVNKYPLAIEKELNKNVDEVSWGQRVRSADAMSLIAVADVTGKIDQLLGATEAANA